MNKWLAALKKYENAPDANPQNPQNPLETGFEGFEGSRSGDYANFSEAGPSTPSGVLKVPVSGENENFSDAADLAPQPKTDAELYLDALRVIGPCGYGPIAVYLGWGASKASGVETEVRLAGLIRYDRTGRATVVETDSPPF